MCYNRFLREDLKEDIELACVTEVGKLFHANYNIYIYFFFLPSLYKIFLW